MLNLLQRACGIATLTRSYVDAVAGTRCRVLHTRKTAPGLRALDIAAVIAGGGTRHRADLSHEVMVKDNHWQALVAGWRRPRPRACRGAREGRDGALRGGGITRAGGRGVSRRGHQASGGQPDAGDGPRVGRGGAEHSPDIEIEATGGITLENVRAYAEAGADYVSVGALTHSVRAADLAVEVRPGS